MYNLLFLPLLLKIGEGGQISSMLHSLIESAGSSQIEFWIPENQVIIENHVLCEMKYNIIDTSLHQECLI